MKDKIPCQDCLLIPVCRYKNYWRLFKDCGLIKEYGREKQLIVKVQKILNPTKWGVQIEREGGKITTIITRSQGRYLAAKYTELDDLLDRDQETLKK